MKKATAVLVLILVVTLASIGSNGHASFTDTAWAAYRTVQKGDWKALCKLSDDDIVIAEYWRDYEKRSPSDRLLLSDAYKSDLADCERVIATVVDMKTPPRKEIALAFKRFSKLIRTMNEESKDMRVEVDLHSPEPEAAALCPAIRANVGSDRAWRIELSHDSGSWKVVRLVTIAH